MFPRNQHANIGDPWVIKCPYNGAITWTFNAYFLPSTALQFSGNKVLLIKSAQLNNIGVYSCVRSVPSEDGFNRITAYLKVYGKELIALDIRNNISVVVKDENT